MAVQIGGNLAILRNLGPRRQGGGTFSPPQCVSTFARPSYNGRHPPAGFLNHRLATTNLLMSTIAPPPKPTNPVLVDSEGYIDEQIRRTRRSLKLIDLAAGTLTLLIGLLGFVLVGALIDHWIVPGGLSLAGRAALFAVMLAGVAWYGWRQFVPLLKPINPVYAAQTIERHSPTLKNSLLNLLLFRSHRNYLSARVYHALEQQTAVKLATSGLDGSIDRSALLRLGYVLLGVIAVCAIYAALSPKSIALSTARVLAPWADLTAPSRVQILDVKPGKASVARGERVEVSAEINGLSADEPVRLRYSTADERTVDESIRMERPAPEARRFVASLPRGADAGVEQDLTYWLEAGDARSRKFKLTVFTRPTLMVQKIHYAFPPYTGLPSKETNQIGAIRGVEGTKVTVSALASQPIKNAYIDFEADGTSDLPMSVSGDRASASFTLKLRDDRRTPEHMRYALRFTAVDGRQNADPPVYSIEVTPDYAPEVSITQPEAIEEVANVGDVVPIGVEARDPDYGVKSVTIMGKVDGGEEEPLLEMIDEPQTGRVLATKMFTPGDAGLKPGDVLEYWAVAKDTRPEANIGASEHHRLKIIGPNRQQGKQQQQPNQGDKQQPNQGDQGGEKGDSGQGGAGGAGGEGSESGEGGDQAGAEGASGEGQSGESGQEGNQSKGGAGGGSGENQSGESTEESDQPGENGGGGTSGQGEKSPDDAPQQGSSGGAQGGEQRQEGSQSSEQNGESSEAGGADTGEAGGEGGKVSSAGDDDAEALRRMMEHLKKQNPQDGSGQPGEQTGEQQPGEAGDSGDQTGEGAQQSKGAEGQPQANQGQGAQQQGAKQQGAGGKPQEGAAGENQQPNAGEQPGQSPENAASGAKGESQQGANGQQPQGEGAQPPIEGEPSGNTQQPDGSAGENPNKRNGAGESPQSKPGEGEQEQQEGDQGSPNSVPNQSGGDSGAGHRTGKEQGAPGSDDANRQGTKKNQEDNRPGQEDNEAPVGSPDKKESDSQGGPSGEQSGGGQEGGGQQAKAAGKGGPGEHESADEGAGKSQEQGEGEAGSKAGDQQTAGGKTGKSSGDQTGNGSKQGDTGDSGEAKPGEQKPGEEGAESGQPGSEGQPGEQGAEGSQNSPSGEQPSPNGGEQQGQSGEPSQGNNSQGQQGQQGSKGEQPGGESPGNQSPAGSSQQNKPQEGKPNDQQSNEKPNNSNTAGSAQPVGGGTGSNSQSSSSAESGQLGADEANLDYARQQTNLVLEGLDQQLAKKQVDRELLKNLGWTEAELKQFVDRWKNLKERAEGAGNDAAEAQQELDDALGSLGLRNNGPLRFKGKAKADDLRANDALRVKPPSEYADRVREYTKGLSTQRKD